MLSRLAFDILAALILAATAALGAYTPLFLARRDRLAGGTGRSLTLILGNMFSAGVMVSAGFVHLLGEAVRQMPDAIEFSLATFLCGLGYLLTLCADKAAALLSGMTAGDEGVEIKAGMDLMERVGTPSGRSYSLSGSSNGGGGNGGGGGALHIPLPPKERVSTDIVEGTALLRADIVPGSPSTAAAARRKDGGVGVGGAAAGGVNGGRALEQRRAPSISAPFDLENGGVGGVGGVGSSRGALEVEPSPSPFSATAAGADSSGVGYTYPTTSAIQRSSSGILHGHGHGHRCGSVPAPAGSAPVSFITAVLMGVALCFHSLLEGAAMGAQPTLTNSLHIFIAIVSHKGLAAYALGSSIVEADVSPERFWSVVLPFTFASPVGIFVGYGLSDIAAGAGAAAVSALASGTFLYVAFMEVIPRELHSISRTGAKLSALMLGFGLMSLLAIWA